MKTSQINFSETSRVSPSPLSSRYEILLITSEQSDPVLKSKVKALQKVMDFLQVISGTIAFVQMDKKNIVVSKFKLAFSCHR